MTKIDTQFMTKTAEKPYFGAAHTYIAHIREYPPPGHETVLKPIYLRE